MLKTRITEMLGIEHPIIAGPMAYISDADFVAAVSNAGGMGILASLSFKTPGELGEQVLRAKSLTDKPFAVNITLLPTAKPVDYGAYMKAAIKSGATIIETSGRSPEPYMDVLKEAGVVTMHRATRTRDLRTAERVGIDIVSIVGMEAAGHPGQEDVTTMVRVPIAVDAVSVPVIAAGGISDGRGMVAAMSLGAEAVLMGTRFMCSQECKVHANIKEWLKSLNEMDTIMTQRSLKNATRVVRTEHTEKILNMENQGATLEELLPLLSGQRGVNAYETGDTNQAQITVGQCVGMLDNEPTVKEIIDGMVADAKGILGRLHGIGLAG